MDSILQNENWRKDTNGYWYQRPDGTYPVSQWESIDGHWYYFNASGYMISNNWLKLEKTWYYLDENGAMYIPAGSTWEAVGIIWTIRCHAYRLGYLGNGWYYFGGNGAIPWRLAYHK